MNGRITKKRSACDEVYHIKNFEKLNGCEKDERTYIAIVKYDMVFKIDIEELGQVFENMKNSAQRALAEYEAGMNLSMKYGQFREGDQFEVKKELKFIDTDNGWRL